MIIGGALIAVMAQGLSADELRQGPPRGGPEFFTPAVARHEIILQCGTSAGLIRWTISPDFRLTEFVLDGMVVPDSDLARVNEAASGFGERTFLVSRCNAGRANLLIYDLADLSNWQFLLFEFTAGRLALLRRSAE
jgi:hypothetical protein